MNKEQEIEAIKQDIKDIKKDFDQYKSEQLDIQTQKSSASNTVDTSNLQTQITNLASTKQNKLTAGENITINQNVISASVPQIDTTNLQPKLTAGANITIDANNQISATNTTYLAGNGINISNNQISADTSTLATKTELAQKQNTLIAGQNITIDQNNVISAIASGGSGGMTPEQQNKLDQTYNYFLTHIVEPDPYYNPQTFSDYPAGTILQGYAEFNRTYNIRYINTMTSPKIVFSAISGSYGTLKLKFNFKCANVINGLIKIYQNDSEIYSTELNFPNQNNGSEFYVELNGITMSNGNIFYFTVQSNPQNLYMYLTNIKCELIAPNAEVINYISPFAVDYFNGKYYLSDCSSGKAKVAEIEIENMFNMNNLTWNDTGIECRQYKTGFLFNIYSNNATPGARFDYYYSNDNKIHFTNMNTNNSITLDAEIMTDWITKRDNIIYFASQYYSNFKAGRYGLREGATRYTYQGTSVDTYWNLCGSKHLFDYSNIVDNNLHTICTKANGQLYTELVSESGVNPLNLGFGTRQHNYITSYDGNTVYFSCFVKHYDKIVKHNFSYNTTTKYSLTNSQIIGAYEEYFEGANNDYFVVKNGLLEYHKKS